MFSLLNISYATVYSFINLLGKIFKRCHFFFQKINIQNAPHQMASKTTTPCHHAQEILQSQTRAYVASQPLEIKIWVHKQIVRCPCSRIHFRGTKTFTIGYRFKITGTSFVYYEPRKKVVIRSPMRVCVGTAYHGHYLVQFESRIL